MQNVVPTGALTRRSRNLLVAGILLALTGVLGVTLGLFMRAVPLVVQGTTNYGFYITVREAFIWIGVILFFIALVMIVRAVTWRRDNKLAIAVGDALEDFLDERFIFIRNISKFSLGYVDGILIGPPGLLVFRITQRSGVFYNEGTRWMRQLDKGQWRALRWSPTDEAVKDIQKLREFLQARNLTEVPVFGVVVFTEDAPATQVTVEAPVVPVLQPQDFEVGLRDYFGKDRIPQATANQVARLLYQ